ncbi:hypothetical protein [Alkalihalobacillus sp. AL-G]|uniref:hypothetical protein n=1 Tax=Alkalihalobacillus sp. AL-G TaxID=2926399 RepID=UPI00272DA453|nr:hypothetical protein [Alkalihalobacillus sp. AL-G]WLD94385.1 hypothetical protein MOJ78_05725 [Alkalihalobacillus sp. AL-G]
MKSFVKIIVILTVFAAFFVIVRFGDALSQEGNPVPILTAITKLHISNNNYEPFSESDFDTRYVSENTGKSRYNVVKEFMEEKGWVYQEQMGSGLIFKNSDQTITISTIQYSRHYILWNIPNEIVD